MKCRICQEEMLGTVAEDVFYCGNCAVFYRLKRVASFKNQGGKIKAIKVLKGQTNFGIIAK